MATGFEGLEKFEKMNPIKDIKVDSYAQAFLLQKVIEHKLSKDGYQSNGEDLKRIINLQKNKEDFVSPAHKNDFRAAERDKQKVVFPVVENLEVSVTRSLKDKNRFEVAVYETGKDDKGKDKKTLVSYDDIKMTEGQNILFRNQAGQKFKLDLIPSGIGISMQIYTSKIAGNDGYVPLMANAVNKPFPDPTKIAVPSTDAAKLKPEAIKFNADVQILQRELNKLGLASTKPPVGAPLIEDGKYGPKTQMALAEFIAKVQMTDAYKDMCGSDNRGSTKCNAPDMLPGPSLQKAMQLLLKPGAFKPGDYRFENIIPAMKNLNMLNLDQNDDDLYGPPHEDMMVALRRAKSPQNTFVPGVPPAPELIGIPPIPSNIPAPPATPPK